MATHFRENATIESVADTCDAVTAGLEADSEAAHLAPHWQQLTAKADGLLADNRRLERGVRRKRAVVTVLDARWDPTAGAFGRAVVDATYGKRTGSPYDRFFAKVTPSSAQTFGAAREVELGRSWVRELARDPQEPLAQKWHEPLGTATEALAAGVTARDAAVKELGSNRISQALLIEDANVELDRLEGDLMKLFPRQADRVAAFLSPTRPATSRSGAEPPVDPEPATG